jgi:hypothetical protein
MVVISHSAEHLTITSVFRRELIDRKFFPYQFQSYLDRYGSGRPEDLPHDRTYTAENMLI